MRRGGICQHARRRSECKECGGGSISQHNRIRSSCITCKADKDDSMSPDLTSLASICLNTVMTISQHS